MGQDLWLGTTLDPTLFLPSVRVKIKIIQKKGFPFDVPGQNDKL